MAPRIFGGSGRFGTGDDRSATRKASFPASPPDEARPAVDLTFEYDYSIYWMRILALLISFIG